MSIIHMDGFDEYAVAADLAMAYSGGCNISLTEGRWGGGCLDMDLVTAQFVGRALGTAYNQLWTGAAVNMQSLSAVTYQSIIVFLSGSTVLLTIAVQPTSNQLSAWKGDFGTFLGTTSVALPVSNWTWLEAYAEFSTSTGAVEIWLNGTQALNLTGLNLGATGADVVGMGAATGSRYSAPALVDDWYILDPTAGPNTGRLGDCTITTGVPASDAGPNDGTPSVGTNHYACVDEAQWSSANTLTLSDTSGQAEMFGVTSLGITPANVFAVRVVNIAEASDASNVIAAECAISSSGAGATGPTGNLGTTYGQLVGIFETDPHTSAAWTTAGVNAISAGFEVTS